MCLNGPPPSADGRDRRNSQTREAESFGRHDELPEQAPSDIQLEGNIRTLGEARTECLLCDFSDFCF